MISPIHSFTLFGRRERVCHSVTSLGSTGVLEHVVTVQQNTSRVPQNGLELTLEGILVALEASARYQFSSRTRQQCRYCEVSFYAYGLVSLLLIDKVVSCEVPCDWVHSTEGDLGCP